MIRENQKYFNGLQVFFDIATIYISFVLAYYLRFYILKDGTPSFTLKESLLMISLIVPIYVVIISCINQRRTYMIRENQKYFNGLQVFFDIATIYISFVLAYYLRFYILKDGTPSFTLKESLLMISLIVPIYVVLYSWFDLYSSRRTKSFSNECMLIISCNILAILLFIVGLYLIKEMNFSRQALVFFAFINPLLSMLYRGFLRFFLRHYRKKGYNLKHCFLLSLIHY